MANTSLHDVASVQSLQAAWKKISAGKMGRASAARPGADGQSLKTFSTRLDQEIASISAAIRQGRYKFSPLDPYFIPKADGKSFRVICVPTVADRVVQRAILNAVAARQPWMKNPISFGFVTDGGVIKAAQKAIEYRSVKPWVFKTDITKFFDLVNRALLREKVKAQVRQRSVHSLMNDAIACEIKPREASHVTRLAKLDIVSGRGVRQGMPLSPFFANLFMARFDKACTAKGLSVIRYADDLIFFARTEVEARSYEFFCIEELKKLDLKIPELLDTGKTRIYGPSEPAEFLGVELATSPNGGYEVRVGKKQLNAMKDAIYSLGDLGELRRRNLDVTKFGNSLSARVAAYSASYEFCANINHVNTLLSDWNRATKLKIAKALGIDTSVLPSDGKWFLGIE